MPKRSCPFTESFSTQYKIHVGQKELSLHGVFGNKYRQEVYEKTKNLLFSGTRAVMGHLWKVDTEGRCTDANKQGEVTQPTSNQMLLRGQTLIGFDGKLKKSSTVPGNVTTASVCGVCQRASATRRACSQCDRPTCPTCTQQCSNCSSQCCSICTVTEYPVPKCQKMEFRFTLIDMTKSCAVAAPPEMDRPTDDRLAERIGTRE